MATTIITDTNSPEVKAILEESTLTPLRGVQHKDTYGNVISMYFRISDELLLV